MEASQEYQLKAAFVFNFARFASWPQNVFASPRETINFCVIGPNPFASSLGVIEQKTIGEHRLRVHYLDSVGSDVVCHVAFFVEEKATEIFLFQQLIEQNATMTISDSPGFVKNGGDIEFVKNLDRIQFAISNSSLRKKGIVVSSSLLELAVAVG